MKPDLTQARLKEVLNYDPETGHFTWLVSRRGPARIGSRAGTVDSYGYILVGIDGRSFKAHRLAFLYMTGAFPPAWVDHANREKSDNRWENLRPATPSENRANEGLRRDNTTGYKGVSWNKRRGKWHARGRRGGRVAHLGYFDDLEEAAEAARAWRKENHGAFAGA